MIGQTISHYPALWDSAPKGASRRRNKILEKLGEVPKLPTSVFQRVAAVLSIPPSHGGSGKETAL